MFTAQNEMTSPGDYEDAVDALPDDVPSIVGAVRGLLVHGDSLELYDLNPDDFSGYSRETLPLKERLSRIVGNSPEPLDVARPSNKREIVTCRDYAVMTCGFLRRKKYDARVRCGFAAYLSEGKYEDHWICEHRQPGHKHWLRVDAQLDETHRRHLGVAFDATDMPDGAFLTADEAWRLIRSGQTSADRFGHGDAVGEWFLWVNLARDCLSLDGSETSAWDTWREAKNLKPALSSSEKERCDAIAGLVEALEQGRRAIVPELKPFWLYRK